MKKNPKTPLGHKKRLSFLGLVLTLFFSLLVARFYQIQIVEGEKWKQIALSQHQTTIQLPFMRGSFYSNTTIKKGHPEEKIPFVIDVPKFHLYIDPDAIPSPCKREIAEALLKRLPLDKERVLRDFFRKSRSRKIASWLDRSQREDIESWWRQFLKSRKIAKNALFFISDYKRSYPFGSMLGAVLHTVQELKDPVTCQSLPTGGLEMLLDPYLQGKLGKKLILRSPSRPLDTGTLEEPPENGADVYLTINHYLQAITENELEKGVVEAGAIGGWAVMMDPNTGEILALAQTPRFDPTHYKKYFNDPALQEYTRVKAVSDAYEPGSIFKAITLTIGLKASEDLLQAGRAPLFRPEEKIATADGRFPGRGRPLKDGRRHDYLNMNLAMQKSSNIYPARIAERIVTTLGDEWYREALIQIFGFGEKTGIEIPSETPGLVPKPGRLHPNGRLEWSLPTPYSLAIGHNVLINSVQMVKAFAIIASGGYSVRPHLIRKIVKMLPSGEEQLLVDNTNLFEKRRVLSHQIADAMVRAMKFSTKLGGTSPRADVRGYTEAGKSGTSEKIVDGTYSKTKNISSFVGFAPAHNPRFVLLVSLDEPERRFIPGVGKNQHGGVCAAPIFREIAQKALQYLGVTPDDPCGYPYGDPRRDVARADWIQEVNALKALYIEWNGHP